MPQNPEGLSAAEVSQFVRKARRELSAVAPFLMMVIVLSVTIRLHGQANESGAQDSSSKSKEPAVTERQATDSNANAEQQTQVSPPQRPIHIVPYGPPAKPPKTRPQASGALSNQGRVQYWGGPVISKVNVVEVLWGNFVDGPSTTGLDQFFTDITSSNYFGLLAEYSTVGLTGFGAGSPPGSNQTIVPGMFGGKFTISPSVCPGGATNPPCTINDTQIQNELVNQVNSSALPQPLRDNQGNFNTLYMIYFPPGVTINLGPGVNSCQPRGFCAYHSNVLSGSMLPYGVLPDFSPASGCGPSRGCGNGTSFQNLTAASSHEFSEAVTDVDAGTANAFAPPLAWADQNTGEEIGDICAHNNVQVTANGTIYTVQTEWSNMQNGCVSAPPHFLVQPATANAVPGSPFQITVTALASFGFQLSAYNDTVHFTSSDPAAARPADYTFVPSADNGSHTFTVTLNTTGSQTITANDTVITAMTGSGTVDVEHNPDLTVISAHTGNFKQGDASDTYTLTVTNVGDRPTLTSAPVTVTDSLPAYLTATAMSGTGWSCTLNTLSCTRSDSLMPSNPYPAITLTVSVANFTPALVTNNVQVSGGGEVNTSNDMAADPTTVIQMPDLSIFKTHVGVFAQGQVNENYTLTVSNFGFAPTDGTLVTVTDTLPMGLTATAIGGAGWSCSTPPTLTCTRSDVLNNGSAYPPITLTVNVAANAPMPTVTNTATVSGGGEINPANDTANDFTTITQPASDLVVASTHSGSFTQGQTGATYSLTVSNVGPLATSGQVTLTDTLPFGLTPTAMSGTGWTCTLTGLPTCTRSDSLAAFTGGQPPSYPPVTLTVNVANNEPTPITNFASVSGGGELNTVNDSSSDSTVIIQLPDLVPSQSHGPLVQGLTGVNYMLNVSNITAGTTSGTVTVTDTLPAALTATAMSGPGWNCALGTLTCTRSDTLGPFSSYPAVTLTVSVANNAPSSVTNTITVSGGGEIITSNDTSVDNAQVGPPVSVSTIIGFANVIAGFPANFLFSVNAPLASATNFSCSGLPGGTNCMFNPSSVSGQFNATVSLTITTSGGVASAWPLPWYAPPPLYSILLPLLGIVGMGMRPRGGRRSLWLVAGLVGLAFVLFLAGCGGGNGGPPPPPPRTPAGTYTITVTGNNPTANFQASTTVTLQVQ